MNLPAGVVFGVVVSGAQGADIAGVCAASVAVRLVMVEVAESG